MKSVAGTLISIRVRRWFGRLRLRRRGEPLAINRAEYRVFSQHREDGVIDHLLNTVPPGPGLFVEFGFAPDVCNCLNLVVNRGFSGLFIDGSASKCDLARRVFRAMGREDVKVARAFLDVDNINRIIASHGIDGEIDVLSVDVDGNDYWFLEAIDVANPRIVVIEYNASLGVARSLTVPYDPGFVRYEKHDSGFYHGASLLALSRLAARKGYRLVGCDSTGVNAFFLRNDLPAPSVETLAVETAFRAHRGRVKYKKVSQDEQFARIRDMPFVEIAAPGTVTTTSSGGNTR